MIKFISEECLCDFIIENNKNFKCFQFYKNYRKEFYLGYYGRADILSWDCISLNGSYGIRINIYELKNVESSYEHIGQLCRYMTAIRKIIDEKYFTSFDCVIVRGFLVTPSISLEDDFIFLYNELNHDINIITFKFDELGNLRFEKEDKTYCIENKIENSKSIDSLFKDIDKTIGSENAKK